MQLLLKRDRLGNAVSGSTGALLKRARMGDDIVAFEESSIFTCHIFFANVVVSGDRISGLSLPHLAFGDLRDEERLLGQPAEIIYYVYDSMCSNLLGKDIPDEERTVTEFFANNPHYAGLTWYSTRRYEPAPLMDVGQLRTLGDQFKLRLRLSDSFTFIMRPDIVYFPDDGRAFLVKSAPMMLPTAFAADPRAYAEVGRPLVANTTFSVAYLNLDSDGLLTLVHTQRFSLDEDQSDALQRAAATAAPTPHFLGRQARQQDPPTAVTQMTCEYDLLAPAAEGRDA